MSKIASRGLCLVTWCACVCVCVHVSYYVNSGADNIEDDITGSHDSAPSPSYHNTNVSSSSPSSESGPRLMRSTSDRSPRRTAKHHHDDQAPTDPAGGTQWTAAGERSTLPRASKDSERTGGDVWRPMNDVDVPARDFSSPCQPLERAGHKGVAERSMEKTKSSTWNNNGVPDSHQSGVWNDRASSPWETCPFTTQSSSRQTSVQTLSSGSGERLNNYGRLDYCNSLTQQQPPPETLSRSWFDIDRPQARPTTPMSAAGAALGCVRQSSSTDSEKPRGGTITETKTVCSICSSEAFIADSPVVKTDDQSQVGALRDRAYRGMGGGSLPRCYGQRAGDLGTPGSASSMPRGMTLLSAGSAMMPSVSAAVTASSAASSEFTAMILSTAAAGSDVRMMTCPSPKRSLSSRDDECK